MPTRARQVALVALTLVALACGGRAGQPPGQLPVVRGADGRTYTLLDKGAYKAFYDSWGRLVRIEYDSNGDGKPDYIAHHDGAKTPRLIEVDEDFDGNTDRWESYSPEGRLLKVGVSRHGHGPDLWNVLGPDGQPARREYDDDGDGRVERSEVLSAGRVVRVEIDADHDGRTDRWQDWRAGQLVAEDLDTNGDGRPDRRLRYGAGGTLAGVDRLDAR
jgi:hypothetical protein